MRRKKPKRRITVKARAELEQRFLGKMLSEAGYGDIRGMAGRLGISWRQFRDKRHRALWRALEALNLGSIDERMDIIEAEMDAEAAEKVKADPRLIDPETDMAMGEPGSAAMKDFKKRLIEGSSSGLAWLERGLEAAGAFSLAGGKKYLRKLAEIGECELLSAAHLAEDLFGKQGGIKC